MALTYPPYFPDAFLAPVVAAEADAERTFRNTTTGAALDRGSVKAAVVTYVKTVALVGARFSSDAFVRSLNFAPSPLNSPLTTFVHHACRSARVITWGSLSRSSSIALWMLALVINRCPCTRDAFTL